MQAGLNMLISGGTGSGKTTCLNALGASIAGPHERVVTIEETAELQLESMLPDCVGLQARLPNVEGAGAVSIRSLVKNALRMRPTRIIVGRGARRRGAGHAVGDEQRPRGVDVHDPRQRPPPGALQAAHLRHDGRGGAAGAGGDGDDRRGDRPGRPPAAGRRPAAGGWWRASTRSRGWRRTRSPGASCSRSTGGGAALDGHPAALRRPAATGGGFPWERGSEPMRQIGLKLD